MKNETKHTPGPWELERVDESGGEFVYQAMAGGYVIANIAESDYPANETARAVFDARLVVAAPDMLAALRLVLDAGMTGSATRRAVRAAIAKAEGRP